MRCKVGADGRAIAEHRAINDGLTVNRVAHGFAHLDVVPANQDGWTVNPFEGVVKDGYVWGRGAVDMKGALAVQVGVIRLLCARARAAGLNPAKDPIPGLRRDIILTATADEETGGEDGIALVLRDRKHWLDAAVGLTEAGGMTITAAGRRIYPLQVAEKGFARFNITVSGRWGHASMPDSDNALLRAAQIVERVSVPGPVQLVAENEALIGALRAALPEQAIKRLERLLAEKTFSDAVPLNSEAPTAGCAPELLRALRAVLRDTFAPTIIASGIRSNVLPGSATLTVDSRILPGTTREQAQANMLERIGLADAFAALADHHARTSREDGDAGVFGGALDQHARNGGVLEFAFEVITHLNVFCQHAGEVTVAGVPTAGPVAADRQAKAGRMDFLSHVSSRPFSCQPSRTHGTWVC